MTPPRQFSPPSRILRAPTAAELQDAREAGIIAQDRPMLLPPLPERSAMEQPEDDVWHYFDQQ